MAKYFRLIAILVCAMAGGFSLAAPTATTVDGGPRWAELKPKQKEVLSPLAKEWDNYSGARKAKWLGIAERYPSMSASEQERLRSRIADWAKLSAEQREHARTQYNRLRNAPAEKRRALNEKWQEYDALPFDEKQRLKTAPKPPADATSNSSRALPLPKPAVIAPRSDTGKTESKRATTGQPLPSTQPTKP